MWTADWFPARKADNCLPTDITIHAKHSFNIANMAWRRAGVPRCASPNGRRDRAPSPERDTISLKNVYGIKKLWSVFQLSAELLHRRIPILKNKCKVFSLGLLVSLTYDRRPATRNPGPSNELLGPWWTSTSKEREFRSTGEEARVAE